MARIKGLLVIVGLIAAQMIAASASSALDASTPSNNDPAIPVATSCTHLYELSFFELLEDAASTTADCIAVTREILTQEFRIDAVQIRIGDQDSFGSDYITMKNDAAILALLTHFGNLITGLRYAPGAARTTDIRQQLDETIETKCHETLERLELIDAGAHLVATAKESFDKLAELRVTATGDHVFDDNFQLERIYRNVRKIAISAAKPFAMTSIGRHHPHLESVEFDEGPDFVEHSHILQMIDANPQQQLHVTLRKRMTEEALEALSVRKNVVGLSLTCFAGDFLSTPPAKRLPFGHVRWFTLIADAAVSGQELLKRLPLELDAIEHFEFQGTALRLANMAAFIGQFSGSLTKLSIQLTPLRPSYDAVKLFDVIDALDELAELVVEWVPECDQTQVERLLNGQPRLQKVTFVPTESVTVLKDMVEPMGEWLLKIGYNEYLDRQIVVYNKQPIAA